MKLLMSAEIDCADERGAYIELKTSRQMDNERQHANFEKHKLLKFWLQVPPPYHRPLTTAPLLPPPYYRPLTTALFYRPSLSPCLTAPTTAPLFWLQSFLAGVPRIIVGFRDDAGVVKELRPLETMKIPRMVRGKQPPTVLRATRPDRAACYTHPQCCSLHPSHTAHTLTRCAASKTCGTPRPASTSARRCSSGCSTMCASCPPGRALCCATCLRRAPCSCCASTGRGRRPLPSAPHRQTSRDFHHIPVYLWRGVVVVLAL
jgi:hypothetical protein